MASECGLHFNGADVGQAVRQESINRDRQCGVCLKIFSSPSARNRHRRDCHGDRSKSQRSVGALKEFAFNGSAHVGNGMAMQNVGCQADDSMTTDDHSRKKLQSELVWGQCVICLKVFSSSSTLNRHRRDIHGFHWEKKGSASQDATGHGDVRVDGSGAGSGMAVASNASSAFGVYGRQCPVCWKVFSSPSTLNRHRREIHGHHSEKQGSFRCSQCPRSMSTRAAFLAHMQVSHPDVVLRREELLFHTRGAFDEWKSRMEADTSAEFLRRDGAKEGKDGIVTLHYKCHQNGGGRESAQTSRFFCPAHIVARVAANGTLSVTFFSTHMGHQIKSHRLKGSAPPICNPERTRNDGTTFEGSHIAAANCVMDYSSSALPSSSTATAAAAAQAVQRRERLSLMLESLFTVIEKCTTSDEFDVLERILVQVEPALAAVREASTAVGSLGGQPFLKQEIASGVFYADDGSMQQPLAVKRKTPTTFDPAEGNAVADAKVGRI